jgi:hypothetical protein
MAQLYAIISIMPIHVPFFNKKRAHYEYLKNKWTHKHATLQEKLWEKHKDALGIFLAGTLLLASPTIPMPGGNHALAQQVTFRDVHKSMFFISDVSHILPDVVRPLTPFEEKNIVDMIMQTYGVPIAAELQGIRLDRNYGYIGQEQLLPRYPGDTVEDHFDSPEDARIYAPYGMTPGKGAWGYFAYSRNSLTVDDILREKYYIAVPTFLATGYMDHVKEFNAFFKYRKVLVVNPQNGKAIVADIADAGPSPWTGKHLGGSPAVMKYLERVDGAQKGPVLYFFVDDKSTFPTPLGPVRI